jgi:glycosyltransferase involved in cell wall biosynthesis
MAQGRIPALMIARCRPSRERGRSEAVASPVSLDSTDFMERTAESEHTITPTSTGARRRPRILIDAIAYSRKDGGMTTALHDLLRTCASLSEFDFVVAHDSRHARVLRAFGLESVPVRVPRQMRFFASLALLPPLARRVRATAVHCELGALPWGLGVPASLTVNDVYFLIDRAALGGSMRQRVMQAYWERLFVPSISRARVLKTISLSTAADLRRVVADDLNVVICEPRVAHGAGTIRRTVGRELRLLFVGSVLPRRNLPFLLRAVGRLRRPWHLDVVGSLWSDVFREEPRDPRITLHGYVSDERRDALMDAAHLLVAPSRHEGFGYPVAEAMARGVPAYTSDTSSFREYVPDDWRFPLDAPDALTSMLERLNLASLPQMAEVARASVSRFDDANHIAKHRELFGRLLSASHPSG